MYEVIEFFCYMSLGDSILTGLDHFFYFAQTYICSPWTKILTIC